MRDYVPLAQLIHAVSLDPFGILPLYRDVRSDGKGLHGERVGRCVKDNGEREDGALGGVWRRHVFF